MANSENKIPIATPKIRRNRSRNVILAILIICFVTSLLAILRWDQLLVMFVPGLAVVSYVWFFPIMTVILSGACLYQYKQAEHKWLFILLPIVAISGATLTIVLWLLVVQGSLRIPVFLLAVAISACIFYYLCWREGIPSILRVLPVFLSVVLILVIPTFLSELLPCIYTPQALTEESLPLYKECIRFAENNKKYSDLILGPSGWESPEYDVGSGLITPILLGSEKWGDSMAKDEYYQITRDARRLNRKLYSISCWKMQRDNNILLFFKNTNHILPSGPGVAYSLNGDNPNNLHSDILDDVKPFINVSGNWYISRRLAFSGLRKPSITETPKALIDHSLRIEGLNLD